MVAFVCSLPSKAITSVVQPVDVIALSRRERTTVLRRRCVISARQDAPTKREIDVGSDQSGREVDENDADSSIGVSDGKDAKAEDLVKTLAFVGLAGVVAAGFGYFEGVQRALEFVTGYIVEYSLSVDNLFVFLLIFEFFKVPRDSQERVLSYGILGAIVFRGIMIVLGETLTHRFKPVSVGFAAILLYSAAKLLFEDNDEEEDLEQNSIVRFARKLLPFTDHYDGHKFFTMENGLRLATPLMLVLISVELSDVVFALDSVPAVLGISQDTKVVYLSNIMAIMGLRNLYFLLSDVISGLRFLRPSLAIVLGFVGAKMIAGVAGYEVGTVQSLLVILGTLAGGVSLSLAFPEAAKES